METKNFERAKQIETEITSLSKYAKACKSKKDEMYLYIHGDAGTEWAEQKYSHQLNSCPAFLKEQLEDDLNFISDRISNKINKRIAELETEFARL